MLDSERALKKEIDASVEALSMKNVDITCATCLLEESGKNCSVVVYAQDDVLQSVVGIATAVKPEEGIPSDHAHFVVSIPFLLLHQVFFEKTTESKDKLKEVITIMIFSCMLIIVRC